MAEDKIISLKAEIEKLTADLDKAREAGGAGGNLEASAELARALQDRKEMLEIVTRLTKESTEALKEENKEKEKAAEATKKAAEANREAAEVQKKALDELTATQDAYTTNLENTIRTMTGMTSGNETLIGSWLNMGKAAKKLDKEIERLTEAEKDAVPGTKEHTEAAADLAKAKDRQAKSEENLTDKIKKYVENINPIASIVSTIQQATLGLAVANDVATAAFNASSGAAGAYDDELVSLQLANRANGMSTAEMGESYGALQASLSGFGVMAESERMRLGELGAQFAKVGVSGADFAGTLQTMTKGFGMSTRAATGMQEEAMELAQTLGKDVGAVLSEMNAALPQLASYGSDAVDMFFDLEKQAQRTGLEIGQLIGIAGNYRTFDKAAEAAGNLNAVLGTQLFSSMGLLEAQLEGPEAVLAYMSQNLSDSIGDFDSLNTFQKEAVANAANMNVEELNHLMNQKSLTKQEQDRAKSLDEAMAAGRSLWQELTILAQGFAITVTPLMDFLVGTFQNLNKLISFVREEAGFLADVFQGMFVATAVISFAAAIMTLGKAFLWMSKAAGLAKAISNPLAFAATIAAFGGIWMLAKAGMNADKPEGFYKGTDASSKRAQDYGAFVGEQGPEGFISPDGKTGGIVGANGPEFIHPPQGSKVINNTTMTALASQATGRSVAGQGSNTAMVAAVASLQGAMKEMSNRPIEITTNPVMLKDTLGGGVNDHFGEYGTQPIRLRTA